MLNWRWCTDIRFKRSGSIKLIIIRSVSCFYIKWINIVKFIIFTILKLIFNNGLIKHIYVWNFWVVIWFIVLDLSFNIRIIPKRNIIRVNIWNGVWFLNLKWILLLIIILWVNLRSFITKAFIENIYFLWVCHLYFIIILIYFKLLKCFFFCWSHSFGYR